MSLFVLRDVADRDVGEGQATFPFDFAPMVKRSTPLPLAATLGRAGSRRWVAGLLRILALLALGAALTALVYQIPARHVVRVGYDDAAYVQGFGEAVNRWGVNVDRTGVREPYRWSGSHAALLFPQIGLPARATLRWRAYRPSGAEHPIMRVLLNGREELGRFRATGDWEEHVFAIDGGLWKPRDLFLQIIVDPPLQVEGVARGAQVSRAVLETSGWPIRPYPAQLLGGAVATLLAACAVRRPRFLALTVLAMQIAFLCCYRLQVSPYPLRLFWPLMIGGWAFVLAVRAWPVLSQRGRSGWTERLAARAIGLEAVAVIAIAIWAAVLWAAGRAHTVLSLPGVENDFRVFATRSAALTCPPGAWQPDAGCVLRADGFYPLGYPFLLWMTRPLTEGNAFLAARAVALVSAVVLLAATYLLGRRLLGAAGGLLALSLVLLNRWTAQYGLLVGTDLPFAALWATALLVIVTARGHGSIFAAGLLGGLAFSVRHPGVLLLLIGVLSILWRRPRDAAAGRWQRVLWLAAGFLLASLPQLIVNTLDTGNPLFSQQAKNIWLAVYGNTDWTRWGEASNDVSLRAVIAQDPARFFTSWWSNVAAFWGSGSGDLSEFGQALALRLLTFPANLLGLAGLALWLVRGDRRGRLLLAASVLYVAAIAVGFMLPRFVLPLLPVWAVAAVAAALRLGSRSNAARPAGRPPWAAATTLAVFLLLQTGAFPTGVRAVVDGQDQEMAAAVSLVRSVAGRGEHVVFDLQPGDTLGKYSAVAHLAASAGTPGTAYQLTTKSPPAGARLIGRAGRYALYRFTH